MNRRSFIKGALAVPVVVGAYSEVHGEPVVEKPIEPLTWAEQTNEIYYGEWVCLVGYGLKT